MSNILCSVCKGSTITPDEKKCSDEYIVINIYIKKKNKSELNNAQGSSPLNYIEEVENISLYMK